jgi:hypothetical protein
MTIDEYIISEFGKPFVWGQTDCASRACRWVEIKTGKSPSQGLDFSKIKKGFDVIRTAKKQMKSYKLSENPKEGDVGMILIGDLICAAIKTKDHWVAWNESGLMTHKNPRIVWAWDI